MSFLQGMGPLGYCLDGNSCSVDVCSRGLSSPKGENTARRRAAGGRPPREPSFRSGTKTIGKKPSCAVILWEAAAFARATARHGDASPNSPDGYSAGTNSR